MNNINNNLCNKFLKFIPPLIFFISLGLSVFINPIFQKEFLERGVHYDTTSFIARASLVGMRGYNLYSDVWDGHAPLYTLISSLLIKFTNDYQTLIYFDFILSIMTFSIILINLFLLFKGSNKWIVMSISILLFIRFYASPTILELNMHYENLGALFIACSFLLWTILNRNWSVMAAILFQLSLLLAILCKEQFLLPSSVFVLISIFKFKHRMAKVLYCYFFTFCALLLYSPLRNFLFDWYDAMVLMKLDYFKDTPFSLSVFTYKYLKALYSNIYFPHWKILLSLDIIMMIVVIFSSVKKDICVYFIISFFGLLSCAIGKRYYGHYFIIPSIPIILFYSIFIYRMLNCDRLIFKSFSIVISIALFYYAFTMKNFNFYHHDAKAMNRDMKIAEFIKINSENKTRKICYYYESEISLLAYYCFKENNEFHQRFSDPRYGFQESSEIVFSKFIASFNKADYIIFEKTSNKNLATIHAIQKICMKRKNIFELDDFIVYQ